MMRTIGFFACMLMMVSSIFGQIGQSYTCREVKVVEDFDPKRFAGTWYEESRNENSLYERGQKCSQWTYSENGRGIDQIDFKALIAKSGMIEDWVLKTTPIGGPLSPNFDVQIPKPGARIETNFTIMATDYQHYAVQWACQNYGDASLSYVWMLSRTRTPDPQYAQMANKFVEENIDIPQSKIIAIDQDNCPSYTQNNEHVKYEL